MKQFILAIDQGTTGSRALLYDQSARMVASAYQEFRQHYPKPGWVEHDADEIVRSVSNVIAKAIKTACISSRQISAIGITNQRETSVFWDKNSGKPVAKAIVWQDRRTDLVCRELKKKYGRTLRKKTGLLFDPYFSGSKIKWFLDHHASLRKKAKKGGILFGTIDSWLLFKLTGKKVHATDYTNASRTLLFNIRTKKWDPELCRILNVPKEMLPKVKLSGSLFGKTKNFPGLADGIPIYALIGDQQAALFGQGCYRPGESKNTYGTGCFMLLNTGSRFVLSHSGLLTTLACDGKGKPAYALEGAIFIAGAAIQWLRDGLKIIQKASETEQIARQTKSSDEVIVVPAFTGLGAPYWRADVRGAIFGLTRGTTREMVIKATLDSIAFQVKEVFDLMKKESKVRVPVLKVDGGASQNAYLMQLQSDLLETPVLKTNLTESTAWGAAKLAGYASGFWPNLAKIDKKMRYVRFNPKMKALERKTRLALWHDAIRCLTAQF